MPEAATVSGSVAEPVANLWSEILAKHAGQVEGEVTPTAGDGKGVLLVLGDARSGKSALTSRLRAVGDASAGDLSHRPAMALDYSFMEFTRAPASTGDVGSDDKERGGLASSKSVHVWQLQGEPDVAPRLLKFAVGAESLARTTLMIVLDGSQPWSLVEQLRRWLGVFESHLSSLLPQLRTGELAHLKARIEGEFVATQKLQGGGSGGAEGESQEELLESNVGVRVVVVVAKSDLVEAQERLRGFDDLHFQWIHAHLRRVCLRYGASLVYSSSKTGTNVALLRDLLAIRILREVADFPEKSSNTALPPSLTHTITDERDAVFVPAGCDATAKINAALAEAAQAFGVDPGADFEDVIKDPKSGSGRASSSTEALETALEDTAFLQELHEEQSALPQGPSMMMSAVPATPDVSDAKSESLVSTPVTLTGTGFGGSQPASTGVTPVRAPPAHLGGGGVCYVFPSCGDDGSQRPQLIFQQLDQPRLKACDAWIRDKIG